ncbi:hypothetical protein [Anatilimnocola floriformis]
MAKEVSFNPRPRERATDYLDLACCIDTAFQSARLNGRHGGDQALAASRGVSIRARVKNWRRPRSFVLMMFLLKVPIRAHA